MRLVSDKATLHTLRQAGIGVLSLLFAASCGEETPTRNTVAPKPETKVATRRITNEKYLANLPPELRLPEENDEIGWRILSDYGAVFVGRGVTRPPTVRFKDETETAQWQAKVKSWRENLGGIEIELQQPAMESLRTARAEARQAKLDITPRGADSGRRSYEETVTLWRSRVNPALAYWVARQRLTADESARIKRLDASEQAPEVLRLESQGIYFSKDLTKSILYSVAAPGSSQHISMLALDIKQHENPLVRELLARHGWFQTVATDLPHFTFLGMPETKLPEVGLKRLVSGGRTFWIPSLTE
jgi:hypothetical protein